MTDENKRQDFENLSSDSGIFREFWEFLRENKKFWLLPIIIVLALLGILIYVGSTGAAPFIYTLF